ncbi:MAG: hypothetical protein R3F14_20310 [Polyangiaceae bacterium]
MSSDAPPRGPGLAKTRGDRLFARRAVELWASVPGAMAAFARAADVVSEGEVREEGESRTYSGSTSLLLLPPPQSGASLSSLRERLSLDPHFRLHALRIAVREARHRAGSTMGPVSAEITFREEPRGLVVTVDLLAPLGEASLRTG